VLFPRRWIPAHAYGHPDFVRGHRLIRTVPAGELVTTEDFLTPSEIMDNSLPKRREPKEIRATTDPCSDFVRPQSRVDVVVVAEEDGKRKSMVLLCEMPVLFVDTIIIQKAGMCPIQTGTVTLNATPDQREILSLAAGLGEFFLVIAESKD
jgi:Flp pilus assembly protein CpaB